MINVYHTVLPLVGGQCGATRNLGVQLTLLQPGGQIMPITLLLAHPAAPLRRAYILYHQNAVEKR